MQKILEIVFIFILFVSISTTVAIAQTDIKATVKAGKHPDYIRVVFTAPVDILNKSSVVLQGSDIIKVDLKPVKNLEVQPIGLLGEKSTIEMLKGLKITSRDNIFFISYENIDDISVSKLANPPRLVIDIYSSPKKTTEETEQITPQKEEKATKDLFNISKKIDIIILDAGHGGEDRGLWGNTFTEKDIALAFVKDLSNAMTKNGKKTIFTRRQDHYLTLKERHAIVRAKRFDLLISIHVSSSGEITVFSLNKDLSTKEKGSEQDIDYKAIKLRFLKALNSELENFIHIKSPDISPVMFAGLTRPGFLIELPHPSKFNYDRKNKDKLITAIVRAVNSIE